MAVVRTLSWRIGITGLLVLSFSAGISLLSRAFVFGGGHAERPIPQFLLLYAIGSLAAGLAFWRVTQGGLKGNSPGRIGWIIAVALLARLFLFPSALIQETDPYRYLWDGNAVLHGVNPYRYAPSEIDSAALSTPREQAWQASTRSEEARRVLARVNHPAVRTVYPPLAQGLFAMAQGWTPWSLLGWRFLVLAADLTNLGLILLVLSRARIPLEWALLYGWSPLVLKEFANSLHLDVFVVLGLLLMMAALQRGRIGWAFAALALAGLVKLAPMILLLPLAGWAWAGSPRQAIQGLGWAGLTLGAGFLPFLSAGRLLFDGLGQFLTRWRVNEGLYALLAAPFPDGVARIVGWTLIALVGGLTALWLMRTSSVDLRRLWAAMLVLLTAAFLLLPIGNPWYFSWAVPFLTVVPVRALLWLSGALGLYYLDFYFLYHGIPQAFQWVRAVEYGSVAAVGAWEFLQWRRSRSFFRFSTSAISSVAPSRT